MLIFIDSSVQDSSTLLKGVVNQAEVIQLDSDQNGIDQITKALSSRSDFDSVHIVSHGSPGTLYLGNDELSLSNLSQHAQVIREWFKNSSTQASLYLYGCNVAAGDAGSEFIEKLTQLTEADIYASAHLVGNSNLGGTWKLKGRETARLAFSANAQATYPHTLARVIENGSFEDGVTVDPGQQFLVTDEANVPGWETNNAEGALTDNLELWIDGFDLAGPAIAAPDGDQFLELNSDEFVVLSQNLDVLAGDVLSYSFFHRGRDGDETIQLEIGGEIITTETTGNAGGFVNYTGTYTYLGDAGSVPLVFRSIVPAAGGAGQLLDDISIDFAPRIEFAAATNEGNEDDGDDIPQLLILGTFTADGSVDVTVTGGSADAGTDFTNTVTVDIAAGTYDETTPVAINLDILSDTTVELDETIEFTLANATGGNNNATAIIADVDGDDVTQDTNTYTILNDDDTVDPTDPPVDPTDPPVDPTDPTDPPVDPTDPPVDIDVDITVLTVDADIFVGTVDVDFIRGLDGNDTLSGDAGDDTLAGNKGDDDLSGGDGDDVIRGRRDNDVCRGEDGDDEVYGDRGNDRLFGNNGDDFVKGGVGKDRVNGGSGNDELIGNGGNDRILCGSGDDSVVGGFGSDRITGGSGSDSFHYRGFGDGGDRITDFQVGVDVLNISQIVVRFELEANASILDDFIQFEQRGSRTIVFLDADGIDGGRSRSTLTVLQNVEVTSIGAASFEFG